MFYYTIYVSNQHPHCLKYSYNCFGVLVSNNCVSSKSLLNGWLFSSLCFIASSVIFLLTTRHEFYLFLVLDSFAFPWTFLSFVPRYNNITWKQFDSLRSCLYDLLDGVGDGFSLGIDLFLTSEASPFQIFYPMTYELMRFSNLTGANRYYSRPSVNTVHCSCPFGFISPWPWVVYSRICSDLYFAVCTWGQPVQISRILTVCSFLFSITLVADCCCCFGFPSLSAPSPHLGESAGLLKGSPFLSHGLETYSRQ